LEQVKEIIDPRDHRTGFVALVGAPNAGKSTLMNQLVGAKVAIVTHKVQTTRTVLRGIAVFEETQVVFVDTPGLFAPQRKLDEAMVNGAWSGAKEADMTLFLIDANRGIDANTKAQCAHMASLGLKAWLVLNKIDLMPRDKLLGLIETANELYPFEETFPVSALTGEGSQALIASLRKTMPKGHWLYPEDQIADAPIKVLAAEITREKLFLRLHEELPYHLTVETDGWEEHKNGDIRIEQTIYVQRDGQKKIVIGKNGEGIKKVSMESRKEIGELVERKIHLFLFVKVREKWLEDPERYVRMGLEFPKSK
jgi:GTP-binding protein Era